MISFKHIKLLIALILLPFKVWAGDSVGTPNGEFTVNEMGAAVYSVPVELFPSGTGFDPQIGVTYNSQLSGYGNVGYGVNITGLSSITRAGKDLFHDQKVEKIKYSKGDTYLLDGKRLILKSGSYGYNNATYTIEGNPYVTVTQIGDDEHSTTYFIYTDANGTTYEYKETQLVPIGDAVRTIAWYISKATNKYGDCIEYKYMTDNKVLYPSEITYGRNGERHKVSFIYAALTKAQKFHFEGGWEGYINRRLTQITSYNGNSIYRRYDFSYNTSSDKSQRKYDRLTEINVYNNVNETLAPLSFNWQYLESASITNSTCSIRTFNDRYDDNGSNDNKRYDDDDNIGVLFAADVNGDGVSDIVRISRGQHMDGKGTQYTFVYICRSAIDNQGKVTYPDTIRYDLPSSFVMTDLWWRTTSSNTLNCSGAADIDGDGINDLILPGYYKDKNHSDATLSFYYILGKYIVEKNPNWKRTENVIQYDLKTEGDYAPHLFMDFDGDGKADILYVEDKKYNNVYFGQITTDICGTKKSQEIRFTYPDDKTIKRIYSADCNADGLADVILIFEGGYKIYFNNGGTDVAYMFTENNTKEIVSSSTLKDYWRMEPGDFNGDGLMDFVCLPKSEWCMNFLCNNGDGTFSITGSTSVDYIKKNETTKDENRFAVRVADFDKDGLSDVMVSKVDLEYHANVIRYYYSYRKTQIRWYLSDGSKPVLWKSIDKTRNEEDSNEGYIFSGDFNGDGYAEIANYGSLLNSSTNNIFTKNSINIYSFSTDVSLGHLASITNGLGKKTTITYASGTNPSVYTAGNTGNSCFPVISCTLALPLVSKVSQTNGSAGTQNVTYNYGDLRIHTQGRGILGFSSMTVNNTTLGSKTETKVTEWDYEKDNQKDNIKYLPTLVQTTTTIDGKTSKSEITNCIIDDSTWNGNFFSYCAEKETTDFDSHKTNTQYTYDLAKGVLTEEINYYDDRKDIYKQTSYSGYNLHAGKYLPNTILYTQKHNDDSEIYKVEHNFIYEENGDIKEDVQTSMYKDKTVTLTTTYTHDDYGNVLTELTSGKNVVNVTNCYEYDTNHLRLVKSYTYPTSAITTYKYDSWGNLISKSDESYAYNILSTTYTYDNWGQLVKTVNPDGTYTSITTEWDTTPTNDGSTYGSVYKTVTTATAQAPITVYYDSEGREVYSSTIGLKGVNISKVTLYNSRGNVNHTVNTTGLLETSSVLNYDCFGRLTSQINSDGSSIENTYNDRQTTIKSPTGTKRTTVDAWGQPILVEDMADENVVATVEYKYNSMGKPVYVTSNGNTVEMTYDGAGNKISLTDPDAGIMTYSYAADGTILSQTDARGVTTNYSYDELGRIKTKTYVDKSGNEKTQINEYFKYGKDIHRLKSQTYDGLKRTFGYDSYGRVISETRYMMRWAGSKDRRTSYTTEWKYNPNGQKEYVTYPNFKSGKITFKYDYDQYGYISRISHDDKSLYSVKSYDGLTLETNTVAGVLSKKVDKDGYPSVYQLPGKDSQTFSFDKTTGNMTCRTWMHGGTTMLDESFEYDTLDRLVNASGTQEMTMSYAENGNILSKTGVGTYTYDTETKPHAVTSVSNDSKIVNSPLGTLFGLNGKIESVYGISYSYMRDYYYGPDDEKWQTYGWGKLYSPGVIGGYAPELHWYFGDYEQKSEDDNSLTEYYFLENDVIVINNTSSASIDYCQAVTDNLGSVLAVYDEFGQEQFCAKYDAWGKQTIYTDRIGLYYGYTGHEMLRECDLIDMGGRFYDPTLGRFLSCDNYVQEPDNSQNFNRYSYCLNNPLRYTDPTGELFGIDDMAIAFAIYGIGTSMMQAAYNGENIWKAGALSLLGSAATYGIGQVFGATGSFWNELGRAGAHGLASGVTTALNGGNFASAFISGAASSGIGSFAQGVKLPTEAMLGCSTVMGGLTSWATGGNFLEGAMNGFQIGLFNHAMHDGDRTPVEVYTNPETGTYECTIYNNQHLTLSPTTPREKGLEIVSPEFYILFTGASAATKAVQCTFRGIHSGLRLIGSKTAEYITKLNAQTGGFKQWVRVGDSYSRNENCKMLSLRWGTNSHYQRQIGNPTLRTINNKLRHMKLPGNNWRVNDPGHFHIKRK